MIALVDGPLEPAALLAAVADPEHGGTALFLGTTRREAGIRALTALEYEAHEALARSELRAIAGEARERFGAAVAVAHRVGVVPVGEPAVCVAASAPHRPAAFAACRFVIDELKRRAPIWKRALHADGGATWLDGVRPVHEHAGA